MSVPNTATCTVIHTHETYEGKQGLTYLAGISAQSAGAQALCLHLLTLPPEGEGMLTCMNSTSQPFIS